MRQTSRLLLSSVMLLALGCETTLTELTTAPPDTVAEIDKANHEISISRGVALAFDCRYSGVACTGADLSFEEDGIASVRPAFFDNLEANTAAGTDPPAVFVLIGTKLGSATLSVVHDDGEVDYEVTVVK